MVLSIKRDADNLMQVGEKAQQQFRYFLRLTVLYPMS